ncbi:very short patch repair endonuclease [bacterium]|nr:very short patch repair endonuclease [bacterium]
MTETPEQRSRIMRAVRSRDTGPELIVRKLLRAIGYSGYRLHRTDLPGRPDIAYIGRKRAVFVHGCFWHGHNCPRGDRLPATNTDYWRAKIERNRRRDNEAAKVLAQCGWRVLVIWECQLSDENVLAAELHQFISSSGCNASD